MKILPALFLLSACHAFAQGDLAPAGTPQRLMKTLDQIESRTPVQTLAPAPPYLIRASGSYYLTGNITVASGNAIEIILANGVTLDLNGYTIFSSHPTGDGAGILVNGNLLDYTIRNGHIRGTTTVAGNTFTPGGFNNGIAAFAAGNIEVRNITVSGTADDAIILNTAKTTAASQCAVQACRGNGIIAAAVDHCEVSAAGKTGIQGQRVDACRAETVNLGNASNWSGISAPAVSHSEGISNQGNGISGSDISFSRGTSSSFNGINAVTVSYSTGVSTLLTGIFATGAVSYSRGMGNNLSGGAISAPITIGCTSAGGVINSAQKHLGTP